MHNAVDAVSSRVSRVRGAAIQLRTRVGTLAAQTMAMNMLRAVVLVALAGGAVAEPDGSFAISHMNDGRKIQREVIDAGITRCVHTYQVENICDAA